MVGELASRSKSATPTSFHRFLQHLDTDGRLLRVYTQNVDCLEEKSGISFGLPTAIPSARRNMLRKQAWSLAYDGLNIPRCIPLHGRIDQCHCQLCFQSYAIDGHIDTFHNGRLPACTGECAEREMLVPFSGKRSRGIGELRPSIILYNESHPSAETIAQVVSRDLEYIHGSVQSGNNVVILVVGTSLHIPGIRKMVRGFSKVVHESTLRSFPSIGNDTTPAAMQSIYLNLNFSASRTWNGVFDAWVQGDLQQFANAMLS
jgi:NAD-dependent SIR2 family protein deacetylase